MAKNPKLPLLEGLLSFEERGMILQARTTAPFHPLAVLLTGDSPGTQRIAANTERALHHVRRRDEEWLRHLKKRQLQTEPLTEAASGLAELRAYGALLDAGLDVSPFPSSSPGSKPDFRVSLNGEELQIEVQAKQHDELWPKNWRPSIGLLMNRASPKRRLSQDPTSRLI